MIKTKIVWKLRSLRKKTTEHILKTDISAKPHVQMIFSCQFQWKPHNSTEDTTQSEVPTTPCRAYHMSSWKTQFNGS